MKTLVRKFIPPALLRRYSHFRRIGEQRANRTKSAEQVFTEIYQKNKWGGAPGEFDSGSGTSNREIVAAYIAMIGERARSEPFLGRTFVDLGCGDFRVGRQLLPLCSRYVGVDVVQPLIARNNEEFGNANTEFVHLNMAERPLPDGHVCFVRQVLQHMSNEEIASVLRKVDKYAWVFITEHYPTDNPSIRPNLDKAHGGDVRVYDNSGVYLTESPFNLPADRIEQVLEVPGDGLSRERDPGVIRTFLYKPRR
jgi:SAM-dependent methyltransferase